MLGGKTAQNNTAQQQQQLLTTRLARGTWLKAAISYELAYRCTTFTLTVSGFSQSGSPQLPLQGISPKATTRQDAPTAKVVQKQASGLQPPDSALRTRSFLQWTMDSHRYPAVVDRALSIISRNDGHIPPVTHLIMESNTQASRTAKAHPLSAYQCRD